MGRFVAWTRRELEAVKALNGHEITMQDAMDAQYKASGIPRTRAALKSMLGVLGIKTVRVKTNFVANEKKISFINSFPSTVKNEEIVKQFIEVYGPPCNNPIVKRYRKIPYDYSRIEGWCDREYEILKAHQDDSWDVIINALKAEGYIKSLGQIKYAVDKRHGKRGYRGMPRRKRVDVNENVPEHVKRRLEVYNRVCERDSHVPMPNRLAFYQPNGTEEEVFCEDNMYLKHGCGTSAGPAFFA